MEMKLVSGCSLCIKLFVLLLFVQGCRVGSSEQSDCENFISRADAEAKALAIANCNAPKYELFKSRYCPPFWTIEYRLSNGQEAYISMDLKGNLIATGNLPVHNEQNMKKLTREISRDQAIVIASKYTQVSSDSILYRYADYHLAQWEILLNLKNAPEGIESWKLGKQSFVKINIREDGTLVYPEWLICRTTKPLLNYFED